VYDAIKTAASGPVAEGNVGAGTGTRALGFKGGIGTSSRKLPENHGGYTVGVMVQSNFGGVLTINGAPVGEELGNHYLASSYENSDAVLSGSRTEETVQNNGYDFDVDGSVMIVIATDAPLTSRNLERLAKRAFLGIARVGGFASNGSGDYVIAFSTHPEVRNNMNDSTDVRQIKEMKNSAVSPLFLAAVEATEEAILNSLFMAETMEGYDGRIQKALPVDEVMDILKRYGADQ
jgi:D-aminopeptidase